MRIAGWVLLVGGLLLCVSISWAALGFLLMGVGLISLQVAERNRSRAKLALASRAERLAAPTEVPAGPSRTAQAPTATLRPSRAGAAYDEAAWDRLVESDSDLLRVTSVLQEYGQPYVDELARAYLADADKRYLPAIVDAVVRQAKRNLAKTNAAPHTIETPDPDRPMRDLNSPPKQASYRAEPQFPRTPARASMTPPPMSFGVAPAVRPVEVPPVNSPSAEAFVDQPAQIAGQRNKTITSADDDLTELIGKFAPNSATLREN